MVLKLYGWLPSPYVQSVMIVLHEKHVPFEFINVDLPKREHKRPEYSELHPFTQVPVIDDDGFKLYESRAICRYIEEKYSKQGTKLNPTDPLNRALIDQATWTEAFHFSKHAGPIYFEHVVRHGIWGKELDQELLAKETETLLVTVDHYERLLSKQSYIAGDKFSLADIYHLSLTAGMIEIAKIDIFQGRPNVERWIKDVMSRDSWCRVKERCMSEP